MTASFGIDHPLLATHDIEGLRNRLIALGFNMTAIGKHPWGTSTSLAMFEGCLLEIMGLYDATLIDKVPAGDFRFGRHVFEHLQQREGVALTALHSTNAQKDAAIAQSAGYRVAGHLEFGRDVTLPDGGSDRTKTTLALLPDAAYPRLSFFLCQQHRPDLIYVPQWLEHPNSAHGIGGITILAAASEQDALRGKFAGLYPDLSDIADGFKAQTANGVIRVQSLAAIEQEFGPLPDAITRGNDPSIVAMDIIYADDKALDDWVSRSGMTVQTSTSGCRTTRAVDTANVFLRFVKG